MKTVLLSVLTRLAWITAAVILPVTAWGQGGTLGQINDVMVGISADLNPAVVLIVTDGYQPVTQGGAAPVYAKQQGAGSGIVLSEDGYIATNAHAVEGASTITVQLASIHSTQGTSILQRPGPKLVADLVGVDQETDLALLKVNASGLPFLELADSDEVQQGQLVFAMGSPLGLQGSLTMGVVSAAARQLQPEGRVVYIQTDTPINPGNSGGPLIDLDGMVIGINTLILSQSGGSEGLGFAVPSNIVRFVVDRLKRDGFVFRGDIGVEAQTITPEMAQALGLARTSGVILADVLPGATAAIAGLAPGDIILTLNEKPMENARQFHVNLYQQEYSGVITLRFLRGTEEREERVVVLDRKNSFERLALLVNEREGLVPTMSVLAFAMDPALLDQLPMRPRRSTGIVVARLLATAQGASWDLLPGDVLYSLNGQPLTSVDQLNRLLASKSAGETVVFQMERGGQLRFLEYSIPSR